MLSVENDWKFEAKVPVKVPFIVVKMISSKHSVEPVMRGIQVAL